MRRAGDETPLCWRGAFTQGIDMAILSLQRTVGQLRHWAEPSREESLADDALLREFARLRSESAFAELVRRHGTMVQGVARRVLGDHHAAEDVLQATFLLLARQAAIVGCPSNLG